LWCVCCGSVWGLGHGGDFGWWCCGFIGVRGITGGIHRVAVLLSGDLVGAGLVGLPWVCCAVLCGFVPVGCPVVMEGCLFCFVKG
jgi:hypothetical protein